MFIDFLFCVSTTPSSVKSNKHNTSSICPCWLPRQHESPGIKGLWRGQAKTGKTWALLAKTARCPFPSWSRSCWLSGHFERPGNSCPLKKMCFSGETNRTCSMAPLVLVSEATWTSWSYCFSGNLSCPLQPALFLPLWHPEKEETRMGLSKSSTPHRLLPPCQRAEKTQNQKGQKHHVLFGGLEKQNGHCFIPTQIASHYEQGNQSSE